MIRIGDRKVLGVAICGLMIATFLSIPAMVASANPAVIPDKAYMTSLEMGLTYIFAVNLPIDIILLATSVLVVCHRLGTRAGRLWDGADRLVWMVVAAGVVVAVVGALADLFMLFTEVAMSGTGVSYYFEFDVLDAIIAAAVVALSIYLVSVLLVRLNKVVALVPAAVIGIVNYASWSALTDGYGVALEPANLAFVILVASIAMPLPLLALRAWHRRGANEGSTVRINALCVAGAVISLLGLCLAWAVLTYEMATVEYTADEYVGYMGVVSQHSGFLAWVVIGTTIAVAGTGLAFTTPIGGVAQAVGVTITLLAGYSGENPIFGDYPVVNASRVPGVGMYLVSIGAAMAILSIVKPVFVGTRRAPGVEDERLVAWTIRRGQ